MAESVITPNNDGVLESSDSTYATARDGGGTEGVTTPTSLGPVAADVGSQYDFAQYFLSFTIDIPNGSTITAVALELYCDNKAVADGFYTRVAKQTWMSVLTGADWRTKAQLDALSVLVFKWSDNVSSGAYNSFAINPSQVTDGTQLELIIWNSLNQESVPVLSGMNRIVWRGKSNTGFEPRLRITYTPPNSTPSVPTSVSRTGLVTDTTPNFSASVSDPDSPSEQIKARFEVSTLAGVVQGTIDSSFRSGDGAVTAEYGSSLAVGQYRVRAKALDDSAAESAYSGYTNFDVKASLSFDSIFLWDVQAGLPVQFDSILLWNVLAEEEYDSIFLWDVEGVQPFSFETSFLWDSKELFERDTDFLWNVSGAGEYDIEFLWNVKAIIPYDTIFRWNMHPVWIDVDEADDALWTGGVR